MFFKQKKDTPKLGDFRIVERFGAKTNSTVYDVQRYSLLLSWDSEWKDWETLQTVGTMDTALDWVERYRKEATSTKFHYCQ